MAYTNRVPEISRIAQSVRDKDFISISEVKAFDEKLNEIIEKFASVNNSELGSQANNIGDLIRQVEYNMADAIIFSETGTIDGYKTAEINGVVVPNPGKNSYDKLVDRLNTLYNDFMALYGNDESIANWKYDLDAKKEALIKVFKDKINGIFGRVAEQNAIESKESGNNDYVTSDAVKINANEIMRLNPDKHAFTRQIIVTPQGPNIDTIAFEVGELEENSLVLNMKIQNTDLYYNYNIVIDNNKVNILKEEHIKLSKSYGITIKIYKYEASSGKKMYVFVLNSSNVNNSVPYCFELSGLLINGYNFGSSGQIPTDHGSYYAYEEVDKTQKPDYNKTYYVKSVDEGGTGVDTNYIIYSVTQDIEPVYSKIYYTKVTTDDGTIKYKINRYLTSFDAEITYYEKNTDSEATKDKESDYVFNEFTHLRTFDDSKTYYEKVNEWELIKSFDIKSTEYTEGTVDSLNKNIDDEKVFENNDQVVIDGVKYSNVIRYKNIDIDAGELFGNSTDSEKAIKSSKLYNYDDGVRFYKPFPGMLSKVRRGAKKLNGNLDISIGSKIAEMAVIQPQGSLFGLSVVSESDVVPVTAEQLRYNYNLILDTNEIYGYDVHENLVNFFEILKDAETDKSIDSFGQTLYEHVMFVDSFRIKLVGAIGSILDFMIIADGFEEYSKCSHIYYNTKNEEVIFPILKSTHRDDDSNVISLKKANWVSEYTDKNNCTALNSYGEVFTSEDGKVWTKNNTGSNLMLDQFEYFNNKYIGIKYDTDKSGAEIAKFYVSNDSFYTIEAESSCNINENYNIKFKQNVVIGDAKHRYGRYFPIVLKDGGTAVYDIQSNTVTRPKTNGLYFVDPKNGRTFKLELSIDDTGAAKVTLYSVSNDIDRNFTNVSRVSSVKLLPTKINDVNTQMPIIHKIIAHGEIVEVFYSVCNDDLTKLYTNNMYIYDTIENNVYRMNIQINEADAIINDITSLDDIICDITDATVYSSDINVNRYARDGAIYILPTKDSGLYYKKWVYEEPEENKYYETTSQVCGWIQEHNTANPFVSISKFGKNIVKVVPFIDDYVGSNNSYIYFFTENLTSYVSTKTIDTYTDIDTIKPFDFYLEDESGNKILSTEWLDREVSGYFYYQLDSTECKFIIYGTNSIYYKDKTTENTFVKSVRGINNSILAINDIVERGNNLLIGESLNGSLQYDKLSGTFSKNVVDNDEYYKYASTSVGVFAYGQGNTYLVDWLHGRTKTFVDVSIDNILECGTDNTIYLFPSNANGLYKYNKENQVITKENVFKSLENIKCEYGFETTDGLFIVGADTYNRNVIYFSKNEFAEDTFIRGGHSDTESQRTFVKLLDCEKIDYCRPLDNEIIISTYDSNEPDVKYYFERNKYSDKYLTFVKQKVSDTNHIYSFNSIETYMGQIFVLNGTGSNPNVKRGFGILSRNLYESGSILEDNKFYDIDIITEIGIDNKIEVMNSPSLFVHGNLLFGVFINHNTTEDKSKIVAYYYDPTLKTPTFVKIDNTSSPLIESILNVANKELSDIEDIEMNGIQFVAIQESNDKTENVIKDYDFKDIIDDYQLDKFYFDKENKGISFGSYINANNYFRIENNCMAFGTTVNTHNTNIAISLPEDMAIAVFDKSLPMLKTVKLRYRELISSSYHYVSIDSRMNIKAIFMGSGSTDNYLYLLITGNFPLLTQSGTVVTETQTSASTNRLFKIAISDIVNSQNTVSTIEFITEIGTNDEDSLINYVKKQIYDTDNLILNEGLDYDVRNKRQFIGTARNVLYNNVDSLVFWNTNSASIDVITPIIWNDDIPDINLSNNNTESETYKDYKIFISNSQKETEINHFYSYDGDKNTKKEIAVNIDENLGTDSEKPGLYAVKTYNEDGTIKETKYEKPDTFFRIGKQIFVKNGRLPLVTDIKVNPNKTDELVSFKVSKNPNFDLRDDIDVNYLKPIYDGALVRTKDKTKSYKISKDGKMFSIDTSDTGSNNDILQTRLGLFRYANDNLYFNPKGVSSTIKIKSNENWPVNCVYESVNGIFISLYKTYDDERIGYLYRMKNIPLDNTHTIYLNDKKYFDEINCNGMAVEELQDTQFGTFAIVGDDDRITNGNPSRILKWNGEDFYVINEYDTAVLNLFDTSEGLFARITNDDYIYKYIETKDTFEKSIKDESNKGYLLDPVFYYNFEHPTYKYYETDYGPVAGLGNILYNFKTKQYVNGLSNYLFNERYVAIRKYFTNNNYKSRNLYKLANYFVNKYNLPLDTNLKVFGSILYNGLQVPVSGMKILSNPGNSTEPFTVSFSIDKDARFTRNIDTIKAFFAKKSNNGYLEDINIGVITDYDTESAKYYDHMYNITKINLVVLTDYNPDRREEEFKAQYEELMSDINNLKTELKRLMLDKKSNVESSDTLLATLERNSDAYTSHTNNGRNIAETYGYTVDANGAISKSEMKELFNKLKQSIKNNDFTKVFIGDYLVLPKLAYSHSTQYENYDNVRFDVMGINTYAYDSIHRGILFQSHGILLPEERTTNQRSYYHHAIACNHNMAEYIEKNYGLLTAPVRYLGNTYYTYYADYLNGIYGLYNNSSESDNYIVYYVSTTVKVFFPAEQEIGHPQQTNCEYNKHSLCVWPLYNKAPQTRIKNLLYPEKFNLNGKEIEWGYWTDSFSAKGTPTNGKKIESGYVVYVSGEGLFLRQNAFNSNSDDTTTTDTTKFIIAQYDKCDNFIGCAPCFYLGTTTETVKTRFIEEYNINPTNKTYNYKYYTINPDGTKEYETTEYSGTYTVLQNVADAMYYVMKYTFKDSSGKVIDTRNAMDLRALFGFTVDSDGLKQLATLLKNDSKARSMCMIGDYITLSTYEWETTSGTKFNINKPKYVLAEVDNGHLIFISSDTHSITGDVGLTWNQLIAENKKQSLMLPILQSQLGITPTLYTRNNNVSYMKNEYVFFPTEFNVFGAYKIEAEADRYSGEKQWELFKNKRFRRALNVDHRGHRKGLYDDWLLATKSTGSSDWPASCVGYLDVGLGDPYLCKLDLTTLGSRPSFMI